ncbi:zinc ribbon domain-containing protein [Agathobaculum hominis]|uniref:Zinc ribbon domain-containing protein n=1 Tax=Agathobaculum hominis TaxID=2763014 RepID=A0ABR7GN32_9FIRM|nr:zinc ribbon domain-containing protein [Agathobaculum hominis]MBC5695701.1 zinc ribbon domain-containing protein [Agathobaculum hominis]
MKELYEAREQIEQAREQQEQYRAAQKASRRHWQGGGFGFSGAIKGAVMAGMLNAGSGLIHGVGDSFAAAGDWAQIAGTKRQVFQHVQKSGMLKEAFYLRCQRIFYEVLETVGYELHVEMPDYDEEKANATFKNAAAQHRKGQLSDEQYFDYLIKCVQLYPYKPSIYGELYRLHPEDDKELQSLSEYLHLREEYLKQRAAVIEAQLSYIADMPSDTIIAVQKKIQALDELAERYHAADDNDWLSEKNKAQAKLQELLRLKDEQERTALGVLLPTKEEADLVRMEWRQVSAVLDDYPYLSDIGAARKCAEALKEISVTHPLVREQVERVEDQVVILQAKQGSFQEEMTRQYRKIFGSAELGESLVNIDSEYDENSNAELDPESEKFINMICDMTVERMLLYSMTRQVLCLTDTMLHITTFENEQAHFVHFPLYGDRIEIEFPSSTMMELHTRTQRAQFSLEDLENVPQFKEMLQAFLREASICRLSPFSGALSCKRLLSRFAAELPQIDIERRERIAERMQLLKDAVLCSNPFPGQVQQVLPNPMSRWQTGEDVWQRMRSIAEQQEPPEIPTVLYRDAPEGAQKLTAFFTDRAVYRLDGDACERLALNEITEMTVHATLAEPYLQLSNTVVLPAEEIGPHHLGEFAQLVGNIVHVLLGGVIAEALCEPPQEEPALPASSVRFCPSCGEAVEEGARFCGSCGEPLFRYCASCGAENDISAMFCMECGEKMM